VSAGRAVCLDMGGPAVPTCTVSDAVSVVTSLSAVPGDRMAAQRLSDVSGFDRLRALVLFREIIDGQIRALECECWDEGVQRAALAGVLGISRAQLYRRHGTRSGQGPPQAVTCDV